MLDCSFVFAEVKDLIRKCLSVQPADRPTVEALLEHPWMHMALPETQPQSAAPAPPAPAQHVLVNGAPLAQIEIAQEAAMMVSDASPHHTGNSQDSI